MAIAKMTLIGMNNYLDAENDDLFSLMVMPPELDKDLLINYILMECGEFPVLWANPYFVKNMIGVWSSKMLDTFTRSFNALKSEYNPIHNYNRWEEYDSNASSTGENKESVSAYDAGNDDLRTKGKDEGASSSEMEGSRHVWGLLPTNNMGISTTVQRMIQAEIELRTDFNIYEIIKEEFKKEFCVQIY